MKWFLGAYSQRFNARHGQRGHVFQGRYKSVVIQTDSGGYFETVSTYIHLNPARAGLLDRDNPVLGSYEWSSLPFYLGTARGRPAWLSVGRVLGNLALKDTRRDRQLYDVYLSGCVNELRTKAGREEYQARWRPLRHHWYVGTEEFGERLLKELQKSVEGKKRSSYSGPGIQTHDESEAERLVERGLELLGLAGQSLAELPKGDARKCALAWLVHSRTTVSNVWISARLAMGVPSNMSAYIARVQLSKDPAAARMRRSLERQVRK